MLTKTNYQKPIHECVIPDDGTWKNHYQNARVTPPKPDSDLPQRLVLEPEVVKTVRVTVGGGTHTTCSKCGHTTDRFVIKCPSCGARNIQGSELKHETRVIGYFDPRPSAPAQSSPKSTHPVSEEAVRQSLESGRLSYLA